jgi:hypothetical protein
MTQSITQLSRAIRAGAFTAMLATIGVTAVMASAQPARASELQAGEAAQDDAINRQATGLGDIVTPRLGPYASARRDRRDEAAAAPRKDFQDIK